MKERRVKIDVDWPLVNRRAREYFGIRKLRPGQREIIETVLKGGNALGIMPTGAGKSLCYQLPALFFPKATVVVSPLISLMQDQTEKLEERGVDTTKLDSTLSRSEERQAARDVKNGHSSLIYVTPERLENPEYLEMLKRGGVSLLVIDEAHCISQWGHDFRPAFLAIRNAAKRLGNPPILALTATATPEVEKDILEQLGIPRAAVYCTGIDRKNLVFNVYRTVNEEAKFQKLLEVVEGVDGNGIVYVSTVKLANELHGRLLSKGIISGKYHGKMSIKDREMSQHEFMENRYRVMVATKAFGLGIDKSDVRFVVHYTFPDSVESYYQEAGRAGRDGKKAVVAMLYRIEDKKIHSFFLGGKYPTQADAAHLYQVLLTLSGSEKKQFSVKEIKDAAGICMNKTRVLLAYLEKENIIEKAKLIKLVKTFSSVEEYELFLHHYEERLKADKERIHTIMRYGQMTECRAQFFRDYFGEPTGLNCRLCDNCLGDFVKHTYRDASDSLSKKQSHLT